MPAENLAGDVGFICQLRLFAKPTESMLVRYLRSAYTLRLVAQTTTELVLARYLRRRASARAPCRRPPGQRDARAEARRSRAVVLRCLRRFCGGSDDSNRRTL